MRKALAIVFLTVGLSSIPFLALGGYRPTIADAQAGPTVVLVAALSSIALGSLLFVQVGKSATAKAYNLTTLARFHSEAMALFYRAQGITDDRQTPQLETELNTWQGGVSEWLQAHLPIYAAMFSGSGPKEHNLLSTYGGGDRSR